jgi:hypothetical protein
MFPQLGPPIGFILSERPFLAFWRAITAVTVSATAVVIQYFSAAEHRVAIENERPGVAG